MIDVARPLSRASTLRGIRTLVAILGILTARDVHSASISIDGGAIVLGRVSSVPVTVRVTEDPGTAHRPLRLSASVGTFGEPTRIKEGVYRATYFPPPTRFPQLALVTIWKETGRDARVDWVALPLFGASSVPVRARPGAEVTIEAGFESFGPVKVGRGRVAKVPIAVPPDVRSARAVVRDGATVTRRELAIEAAPYNQIVAAIVPSAMAADGQDFARLHVIQRDGTTDAHERIRVVPTIGSVVLERAMHGRCTYRYVPPAGTPAKEVSFAISVVGDPHSRASTRIALSFPPPARLFVRPPPVALEPGSGGQATVGVQVTSADGLGLPGLEVAVSANGIPLAGPAVYRGDGVYELSITAPASMPAGGALELRARAVDRQGRAVTGLASYLLGEPPPPPERPREHWSPGWALVGARAGFTHALDDLSGPRAGVEIGFPVLVGETALVASVTASGGYAARTVSDPLSGASTRAEVLFAPVALRLGLELHSTRKLSLVVGGGGVAAFAQARSDLAARTSTAVGFGGLGFVSLGWAIGRGQLFGELSYGAVPVSSDDLRLEAGGVSFDVGYRFGVR